MIYVINNTTFPLNQTDRSGRSNRFNINSSLVIYTAALQRKFTPTSIQFTTSFTYIYKINDTTITPINIKE